MDSSTFKQIYQLISKCLLISTPRQLQICDDLVVELKALHPKQYNTLTEAQLAETVREYRRREQRWAMQDAEIQARTAVPPPPLQHRPHLRPAIDLPKRLQDTLDAPS